MFKEDIDVCLRKRLVVALQGIMILCREEEKTLSFISLSSAAGKSQWEARGLEKSHLLLFQLPQQSSRVQQI